MDYWRRQSGRRDVSPRLHHPPEGSQDDDADQATEADHEPAKAEWADCETRAATASPVRFWLQNGQPECLRACIASITGVHPDTLPSTNAPLTAQLNMAIHAACGKRLDPIYGQHYSDMPRGPWLIFQGLR